MNSDASLDFSLSTCGVAGLVGGAAMVAWTIFENSEKPLGLLALVLKLYTLRVESESSVFFSSCLSLKLVVT